MSKYLESKNNNASLKEELVLDVEISNDIICFYKNTFKCGLNVLYGDNGVGKTTLLKTICGLIENSNEVLLNSAKTDSSFFSFYFSGDELGEQELTIKENILYALNARYRDILQEYEALVEILELKEHEDKVLKYASAGMKQKMCVAICFLRKRKVVILDEPLNYMDDRTSNRLLEYMKERNDIITIVSSNTRYLFGDTLVNLEDLNSGKEK
ncbi:NitT/TauT family transport system ATP-binding protein [Lachnospiraceae bacterium XBB1006]|jgi:ABC-2 type transport system ATP-binding protein|nr:NitT/TauT family transport system ATP-binding protein [Lachnospiraceae bacterium XBB1006]